MTTYNGTISQTIYNNQTVSGSRTTNLNFLNSPIVWTNNVPNDLQGATLNNLFNNSNYQTTLTYNIKINGQQRYDDSSQPLTEISLNLQGTIIGGKFQAQAPGSLGTGTYNINQDIASLTNANLAPTSININVKNQCYQGLPGCVQYPSTNYTFILTLKIQTTSLNNSNVVVHHIIY